MPTLFAHSEQKGNPQVRHLRRDCIKNARYHTCMKLRVTELRKAKGLTVEALAEKAGISKSYLSEMTNGKKPINSNRLQSLAKALGCTPVDLIDDQSIDVSIIEHIRKLNTLSLEDRNAVIQHAMALGKKDESVG